MKSPTPLSIARRVCGSPLIGSPGIAEQKPGELAKLLRLVIELQPQVILEIGTNMGGTLWAWSQAVPGATIISIDITRDSFGIDPSTFADLYLLTGDSHSPGMLETLTTVLAGRQIDFFFIDGDHTYEGVKQDFEIYSPLRSPGGLVAFHDIYHHPLHPECKVVDFWNEIRNRYESDVFQDVGGTNYLWGGIGVLRWPVS